MASRDAADVLWVSPVWAVSRCATPSSAWNPSSSVTFTNPGPIDAVASLFSGFPKSRVPSVRRTRISPCSLIISTKPRSPRTPPPTTSPALPAWSRKVIAGSPSVIARRARTFPLESRSRNSFASIVLCAGACPIASNSVTTSSPARPSLVSLRFRFSNLESLSCNSSRPCDWGFMLPPRLALVEFSRKRRA